MIDDRGNQTDTFENLSISDFNEILSMISAELEFEKDQLRKARKAVAVPHVPKPENVILKPESPEGDNAENVSKDCHITEPSEDYETPPPFNLGILFRQTMACLRPPGEGEVTRGPKSLREELDSKELPSEPKVWIAAPADAVPAKVFEMLNLMPAIEENEAPEVVDKNSYGLYSNHVKSYMKELKTDPFRVFRETEI